MLKHKVFSHSLGARIIRIEAVFIGQLNVELLARRERSLVKSLELVDVIIAENSRLVYQLNHFIYRVRLKVSHCVMPWNKVLPSGFSK